MKLFISGSISIKSLKEDITVIEQIVNNGHTILISDAYGVDKAVQQYLAKQDYRSVIVYFSGKKLRNNIGNWQTKHIPNPENLTGRDQYQLKDKAMADDCDSAVMIWDCKSKGTRYNMMYLDEIGKHYRVFIPDSVEEIDNFAFMDIRLAKEIDDFGSIRLTGLTSVHIPCSISSISNDVINTFKKLRAIITIHPDNPTYTIKNGKITFKKIEATSGRVGKLDWRFSNRVLTIKSNGKISDYEDFEKGFSKKPKSSWYLYRKQIKKIVFKGNRTQYYGTSSVTFENWSVPSYNNDRMQVLGIINKAFKGYTSCDLWNLDHWFSVQFPRMLKDLKNEQNGHPACMTSEEWNKILDRMAFCLSEMVEPHGGCILDEEELKYRDEMKNEGFELLCKYFRNLWW
jgi:hypothetical protein